MCVFVSDLDITVFQPPFLQLTSATSCRFFGLSKLLTGCSSSARASRHLTSMQKKKTKKVMTHTPALFPDVTQLAHIPVLPHLSQHLLLSACLRGLTKTWRAKQSNLRPTRRLMFPLRGSSSLHQRGRMYIRDFTQAAPVYILISSPPHAVLLHVYCMSDGTHAFDISTEVTRLTQTLWSHHRWQMGRQRWGGGSGGNTVLPTSSLYGYK